MTAPLRVVHVCPGVRSRGGIEALHAYHRELPFDHTFLAFFDRPQRIDPYALTVPNYINLNFTWRTPIFEMRRRFRRALAPLKDSIVIHHNGWGVPLWLDLDGASRRFVFFHVDPRYHAPDCPGFRHHLDGAGGITPALQDLWQKALPELTPDPFDQAQGRRTAILRTPISPPPGVAPSVSEATSGSAISPPPGVAPSVSEATSGSARSRSPLPGNTAIRLGYAGRIEKAQKRLDRLPAFLDALDAAGVSYRFEILGDGSYRPELEAILRARPHAPCLPRRSPAKAGPLPVLFHGWVNKSDYWSAMAKWDGVVFFSDHEGGPIGLMEGMALGAIPFYPASLGSWGDFYTPQVDPSLYYKPGDMTGLAATVKEIFSRPPDAIARLREKSAALMRSHTPDEFKRTCTDLISSVASLPRISRVPSPRRPRLTDFLPLGLVTRAFPELLR